MAKKFLDQTGLQYVIEQLNTKYGEKFVAKADVIKDYLKAENVAFSHDNMGTVKNVDEALQVLIANIVRQEDQVIQAATNIKTLEDELKQAIGKKVDQEAYNTKVAELVAEDARIAGLVATEQGRAEGQEAAIRQEMSTEAARVNKKIADDIAAESALRVAEEARIEGKADAAQDAIDVLNGTGEGSVAKDIQDAVDQLQGNVIDPLDDRVAANEAFVEAQPDIDAEQDRRLGVLEAKFTGNESVDAKIAAAQSAAEAKAAELDEADKAAQLLVDQEQDRRIKALEDDAPVKQAAIEAAQAAADAAQAELNAFKAAAEVGDAAVDTLKEIQDYIKSDGAAADEMVKDIAAAQKAADDEATRAKAEEAKIREEFAAADNALDARLDVIEGEATVAGSIKKAQADAIAEASRLDGVLKSELQAEIDADVKVVADELAKQKNADIDGSLANLIADEAARAQGKEAELQQGIADAKADLQQSIGEATTNLTNAINTEAGAREAADGALQAAVDAIEKRLDDENGLVDRIEANEAFVAAQPAIDKAQNDRLVVIEEMMGLGGVEGDKTALEELQDSIDAAQDAADAAQADVDALEKYVKGDNLDGKGGLEARVAANEAFVAAHDDTARDARIEALENANKEGGAVANAIKDVAQDLADFEGEQATKEAAQDDAIQAVADALADQMSIDVKDSLASQIADEAGIRSDADNALANRIKVFEEGGAQDVAAKEVRLTALEAKFGEGEGTVEQQIADAVAAEAALREAADALKVDITAFDEFKGTNTQAIATAKAEAIEEAGNKDATLKQELQKEIDDDVLVETNRAKEAEAQLLIDAKAYTDDSTGALANADIDAAFKAVFGE